MAGIGSKLISSKKSKLLSKSEPTEKDEEVTSMSVRKADGGFIVDCNYGMKPSIAKNLDEVMEILKEYLD